MDWLHRIPDGRVAIARGAWLWVGPPGERAAADEGYSYDAPMSAVLSAARWIESGCLGEPDGWIGRGGAA